jgi:hypothetical protein
MPRHRLTELYLLVGGALKLTPAVPPRGSRPTGCLLAEPVIRVKTFTSGVP